MNSEQVHPRLLTRIWKLRKSRKDEFLDAQVRVYSCLCKATKLLNESQHPADLETTVACAASAQAVRQLARKDHLGEKDTLRKIYDDLHRVSTVICSALGIGPPGRYWAPPKSSLNRPAIWKRSQTHSLTI